MSSRIKSVIIINNNLPAAHNPAVSLELFDTDKGFLPNRLTTIERDAIVDSPIGLVIYNTDNETLEIYANNQWQPIMLGYNSEALGSGNNLSDLENIVSARMNLGLGSIALLESPPIEDPHVVGQIWIDEGVWVVSTG